MAFKILVTGDIHLGRSSGAIATDEIYASTKYVWNQIIKLAIDKKVDVLALTGDIVDRDNQFFEAIGSLQNGFEQLGNNNIEVFVVAGNHDFEVFADILDTQNFPHVHFLGRGQSWENIEFNRDGNRVLFSGWSFSSRYCSQDPLLTYPFSGDFFEIPVIGMIHGDVDLPQSRYAPLSSVEFQNKGVDVWLLGHIHKRQIIMESNPLVLYPGSPQALSPKEKGNHGPILLSIENKHDIAFEYINISPVQYEFIQIDITERSVEELRGEITRQILENSESLDLNFQKVLLYDVILEGTHEDIPEVEKQLERANEIEQNIGGVSIGIRNVDFSQLKARVGNLKELSGQSSPVGMICKLLLALENGEQNSNLDNIYRQIRESITRMKGRNTYIGIQPPYNDQTTEKEFIVSMIRHQCNQLLSELLSQKKNV